MLCRKRHAGIALTGREPKFATSLLTILGRMDLFDLCCLDDCVAQEPVKEALREAFKSKTQAEWIDMLEPLELAWAPVLDMVEAFEQEHAIARDMIVTDPAGLRHVGNPIKFREEPAELRFDVPELEQPSKIG